MQRVVVKYLNYTTTTIGTTTPFSIFGAPFYGSVLQDLVIEMNKADIGSSVNAISGQNKNYKNDNSGGGGDGSDGDSLRLALYIPTWSKYNNTVVSGMYYNAARSPLLQQDPFRLGKYDM